MNIYETIRREIGGYDGIAVIDRGREFCFGLRMPWAFSSGRLE